MHQSCWHLQFFLCCFCVWLTFWDGTKSFALFRSFLSVLFQTRTQTVETGNDTSGKGLCPPPQKKMKTTSICILQELAPRSNPRASEFILYQIQFTAGEVSPLTNLWICPELEPNEKEFLEFQIFISNLLCRQLKGQTSLELWSFQSFLEFPSVI